MSKISGGRRPQARGNSQRTFDILIAALSTIPGATYDELRAHTGLSMPTIASGLKRIATPEPGTFPRRWYLNNESPAVAEHIIEDEIVGVTRKVIPVELGWKHWAQVCMSWPDGIGRLSRSEDPREIAKALATMSRTAAALALVFASVQDEPDWAQRIGAGPQE